jgi:hypothetical protein
LGGSKPTSTIPPLPDVSELSLENLLRKLFFFGGSGGIVEVMNGLWWFLPTQE